MRRAWETRTKGLTPEGVSYTGARYSRSAALHFVGGSGFWELFAGDGFDFAADNVGGEAGAEKAAVERGELFFFDFSFEGAEFALDALANERGFVVLEGIFGESSFDVLVGNAAGAKVARNAEFALAANFGALTGELFGEACVVEEAVVLEALDDGPDERIVVGTMGEGSLELVDRMSAAGEDADGGVVKIGFGVDAARLGEH